MLTAEPTAGGGGGGPQSSPAFHPLISPDGTSSDKTWEARAVFAAVSTAAVTSEDDEDGEIDVGKVRNTLGKPRQQEHI